LPEPVAEYVRQGAQALGCDTAYLALPALSVVASVIGNTRAIKLKGGWYEPSVVWSAVVGDSGTLKTPAYLKAVSYLFRLQKRLLEDHKERMKAHQAAKKKAKEEDTESGEPPEEARVAAGHLLRHDDREAGPDPGGQPARAARGP